MKKIVTHKSSPAERAFEQFTKLVGGRYRRARITLALFTVLLIAAPATTQAQWSISDIFGIGDILSVVIGWVVFVINYIIAVIFGAFIALITYFIAVFLQLNTQVINALIVQKGFTVSLAIANLGFVIGIIVIAIMTILRSQTYGVKQILWKLVVMAVLVNFGLVIAGAIIGFADGLTFYFMDAVEPASSRAAAAGDGGGNFLAFASRVAGAFGPHKAIILGGIGPEARNSAKELTGAAGQTLGQIFKPLLNLFFPTIFLIVIAVVLAVFCFMLLIRYVYLAILLVLLPFAWVGWVFPKTEKWWSEWWNNFLRWTFFAPVVMFFFYLVLVTQKEMDAALSKSYLAAYQGGEYGAQVAGFSGGLSSLFGSFVNSMTSTLLQMTVMLGLAIGGIFAANKLSITGAGWAMGVANSAKGAVTGYAKRRALGFSADKLGKAAEVAQKRAEKPRRGLGRLYGYGAKWASRGLANLSGAASGALIEDYRQRVRNMTIEQKIAAFPTANRYLQAAIGQSVAEEKQFDDFRYLKEVMSGKMKGTFRSLGVEQGREYTERLEKTAMMTAEIGDMYREIDAETDPEKRKAREEDPAGFQRRIELYSTLMARYKPEEFRWGQWGDLLKAAWPALELRVKFEDGKVTREEFDRGMSEDAKFGGLTLRQAERQMKDATYGLLKGAPNMFISVLSSFKQRGLNHIKDFADAVTKEGVAKNVWTQEDADKIKKKLDESMGQAAIWGAFSGGGEKPEKGTPPAPTPPPAHG